LLPSYRQLTIWIGDVHRAGKRFLVRADEKLTAFLELERAITSSRWMQSRKNSPLLKISFVLLRLDSILLRISGSFRVTSSRALRITSV
jgi:hypothetical protein